MDKLNLPVVKTDVSFRKILSMDDYVKFVTLNLKYTVDRKIVREQKKVATVDIRFVLH